MALALLLFLSAMIVVEKHNATKTQGSQSRRAFVERKVIKIFEMLALSNRNEDQVFGLETTGNAAAGQSKNQVSCPQCTFLLK